MAPHTKEAAGSTRFEAGHNRVSLREGKQGVGGWSGDHTNRTNSQRKTAAASALSKPARGNKGGSLIQRTRSEEGERKWWRTAGNSFPQHRKPSVKPGTARPRNNTMQLSRDKSTQNYSELKPGEGDRKLEEGQQPGTPGCFCGLGLIYTNKSCTMPPITFQDLPLNIYMVIFGTGIFIFVLSLIFCCYFMSKLRHQAQSERFGYKETSKVLRRYHYVQAGQFIPAALQIVKYKILAQLLYGIVIWINGFNPPIESVLSNSLRLLFTMPRSVSSAVLEAGLQSVDVKLGCMHSDSG
ncbi:RING finger protein 122 isoform X1 [Pogona vitticeps]